MRAPQRAFLAGTLGQELVEQLAGALQLAGQDVGGFLAAGQVTSPCEDVLDRFTSTGQPDLRFGGGDGQVKLFTEAGPCGAFC